MHPIRIRAAVQAVLVASALLAPPLQAQLPAGKTTPKERATEMKRSGSTAAQVAAELQMAFRMDEMSYAAVLREVGYRSVDAADALTKVARTATDRGVDILVKAGYPKVDAGQAYYGQSRSAMNVAQAMRDAGATPQEVSIALLKAGASPVETATAVKKVHAITAIHMAAELKGHGLAAVAVARALHGAGYSVKEIGAGLKAAGYDVVELAGALKDIGLSLEQTALELRALAYDFDEIANGITQKYGLAVAPLTIALKNAGAGAEGSARALESIGITLQVSASALRAAGYSYMAVGQAFIAMGSTIQETATVMKAAGFAMQDIAAVLAENSTSPLLAAQVLKQIGASGSEVALVLKQSFGRTADQTAATMEEIGFDASQVFAALREHFALSAELAFRRILAEYGLDRAFDALKANGVTDSQAAKFAKAAGQHANAIAKALKDRYGRAGGQVVTLLLGAGFSVNEAAAAVVSAFNASALTLATWLKGANQSQAVVLQTLTAQFKSMTAMDLQQIINQVF